MSSLAAFSTVLLIMMMNKMKKKIIFAGRKSNIRIHYEKHDRKPIYESHLKRKERKKCVQINSQHKILHTTKNI